MDDFFRQHDNPETWDVSEIDPIEDCGGCGCCPCCFSDEEMEARRKRHEADVAWEESQPDLA
jgi:hypothetical protein